jgi:ABC-type transporter Mla subunit MlaD
MARAKSIIMTAADKKVALSTLKTQIAEAKAALKEANGAAKEALKAANGMVKQAAADLKNAEKNLVGVSKDTGKEVSKLEAQLNVLLTKQEELKAE